MDLVRIYEWVGGWGLRIWGKLRCVGMGDE